MTKAFEITGLFALIFAGCLEPAPVVRPSPQHDASVTIADVRPPLSTANNTGSGTYGSGANSGEYPTPTGGDQRPDYQQDNEEDDLNFDHGIDSFLAADASITDESGDDDD